MSKLCAIDVGSNALRMVIANAVEGNLEIVENTRFPLRLGTDVFGSGKVSSGKVDELVRAFQAFADRLEVHQPVEVRAVATSALREARNNKKILKKIEGATGIKLELISGEEEAQLVFSAIRDTKGLHKSTALMIDIGGGSVEVSVSHKGAIEAAESFKIGTVRLLELLSDAGNPKKFHKLLDEYVASFVQSIRGAIGKRKPDFAVGTGGNIETLASLAHQRWGVSAPDVLQTPQLHKLVQQLGTLSLRERMDDLALRPDRADVILPAGVVLAKIVDAFQVSEIRVPGTGVKEGVLLGMLHGMPNERDLTGREHVLPSVTNLAQRYGADLSHSHKVADYALRLFDKTVDRHARSSRDRLLLQCAAILHDIGRAITPNGHHKHSMYLIRHSPVTGLTQQERDIVAHVARYHRKSLPKASHYEYQQLDSATKKLVQDLAGILRLANAMDAEHSPRKTEVSFVRKGKNLQIHMTGTDDLFLEEWAVLRRADLFAARTGLGVEVRLHTETANP